MKVGIIMGSDSDLPVMKEAADFLGDMKIPHEISIVSAHRTPGRLYEYAETAVDRGLNVIIAGAGGSAHLPGMVAAITTLPVIGVPIQTKALNGVDSLYSIVQMPPGIPVATVAINGAKNAGILAASILAINNAEISKKLRAYKDSLSEMVHEKVDKLDKCGYEVYLAEMNVKTHVMNIIQKKIGIIGGGQLGKMMILEAKKLGFYVVILDPTADCPAHSVSDGHIVAGFDDAEGYFELARQVDVITYEFEHINAEALEILENEGRLIYPSVTSLKNIQNKYSQKEILSGNAIPVPRFAPVAGADEIAAFGKKERFGYPLMLKTTTGGYDGKGNALIGDEAEIERAYSQLRRLGGGTRELMVEEFIDFDKEISIIACRGIDGTRVVYPVAENIHTNSILDITIVPARIGGKTMEKAASIADKVMEVFKGVGAFCIELFVAKDGEIYVNEVAPRPHNSGHYTIEGCLASQFENHIRGIVGLPFGSTCLISPTVMVNLLGESAGAARLDGLREAYRDPNVRVHFYGKKESRGGRKMGHFTVVDKTVDGAVNRARQIKRLVRVIGE